MENLFRYDSKFWEILEEISDIVILNFLFIIFSIPIITIGASSSALYTVSLKKTNEENISVFKEFMRSFKSNFKISTLAWIFTIILASMLFLDFYISNLISIKFIGLVLKFISTLVSILLIFNITYLFPMISKFDNTLKNTIINSTIISIQYLPYTIIMSILNILWIVLLCLLFNSYHYILFFYIIIGFGIVSYINSIFLNKIFLKLYTVK